MKIVEFKDYDNQTTPLSAYNLNRLQQNLITTKYQMTFSSAVSGGSTITLPCYYQVGQDTLDVYLNSELLKKASTKDSEGHYYEVGNSDTKSNQIKITSDWSIASGDVLNLIVRGTTDSYDQNLSPDKATQLADEISANKEEITALQTENSRLKGITNALPKISGEDTSLTLTNTANAPLSDIILKGNTSQQQYSGKNLLPLIKGDYNFFNNNVNWKIHNEIIVYNRTNEDIQGGAINLVTGAVGQWGNEGKDLQLKPNTTYTLSFVANGNYTKKGNETAFIMLFLYKGKQLFIHDKNSNDKYAITLTTDDEGYFGVCLYGQYTTCTNFMIYNIQLEEGSTATDYEPYVGGTASPNPDYPQDIKVVSGDNTIKISNSNNTLSQSFPISLGSLELCKIGEYKDYIFKENNKWYKHKVIGKIVFDGTRTGWGFGTAGLENMNVANINIPSMLIQNFGLGFCNYFIRGTSKEINILRFGANDSQLWFYVNATEFTNINDWKTWLSNNNITVYYVLATPIEEEITNTTLISQLNALYNAYTYNDTTNITQTNANLPFYINAEAFKKIS